MESNAVRSADVCERRAADRNGPMSKGRTANRFTAVSGSLVVHAVMLAMLLWQMGRTVLPESVDDDVGVPVGMVSLPRSLDREHAKVTDVQTELEDLRRKLADASPIPAGDKPPPAGQAAELLKAFDGPAVEDSAVAPKTETGKPGGGGTGWEVRHIADRYALASVTNSDVIKTPSPGIWAQVARCWKGSAQNVSVELEFTLDSRGALASAPNVSDTSASPRSRAGKAVATEAARAIEACAPYQAPFLSKSFAVRFGSGEG